MLQELLYATSPALNRIQAVRAGRPRRRCCRRPSWRMPASFQPVALHGGCAAGCLAERDGVGAVGQGQDCRRRRSRSATRRGRPRTRCPAPSAASSQAIMVDARTRRIEHVTGDGVLPPTCCCTRPARTAARLDDGQRDRRAGGDGVRTGDLGGDERGALQITRRPDAASAFGHPGRLAAVDDAAADDVAAADELPAAGGVLLLLAHAVSPAAAPSPPRRRTDSSERIVLTTCTHCPHSAAVAAPCPVRPRSAAERTVRRQLPDEST